WYLKLGRLPIPPPGRARKAAKCTHWVRGLSIEGAPRKVGAPRARCRRTQEPRAEDGASPSYTLGTRRSARRESAHRSARCGIRLAGLGREARLDRRGHGQRESRRLRLRARRGIEGECVPAAARDARRDAW